MENLRTTNYELRTILPPVSKCMSQVANSHQATDHNYEAQNRSERGCSSAPTRVYSGLDDDQIEQPGNYREYFERSGLPVHVIARVRAPKAANDSEGHQNKPDRH